MAVPRRKLVRMAKSIAIITVIAAILFILRFAFFKKKPIFNLFHQSHRLGNFEFDRSTGIFSFFDDHGDKFLSIGVSVNLQGPATKEQCRSGQQDQKLCLQWPKKAMLEVKLASHGDIKCYNIAWTPLTPRFSPLDCVSLGTGHWYGGAAHFRQTWPINNLSVPLTPYVAAPLNRLKHRSRDGFGPVLERYWLNSKGIGIVVDKTVPLHVGMNNKNDRLLCFRSSYSNYPYPVSKDSPALSVLRYSVCKAKNVKDVHSYMYKTCFEMPNGRPNLDMMHVPLWSTYGRFRNNLTQDKLLKLQVGIKEHGFPSSFIILDSNYSRSRGDFHFEDKKFRNSNQMVGEMKEAGYEVIASVDPLSSQTSQPYQTSLSVGSYWLKAEVRPPSNSTYVLDVTNQEALKWWRGELETLKQYYLLKSFRFSGGEGSFLTESAITKTVIHNPGDFTTKYVEFAHTFGENSIITSMYQSQRYPVFVEIPDKNATWDDANGLKTVIPSVLLYGMLGYPFIIPSAIGGVIRRNQTGHNGTAPTAASAVEQLPEQELYIRWMQLSTFLPAMKFSVAPWEYGENVTALAHKLVHEHSTRVFPHLQAAVKEAEVAGTPLIRPLWWLAPYDSQTFLIDSQFLVGDSLMVAPVLEPGARSRDIYLPLDTRWRDQLRGTVVEGGQWLYNYSVPLDSIAVFEWLKSPL